MDFKKKFVSAFKVSNINATERTVTAVISTSAIDRDSEVLLPKGADIEQFEKNPVVLWAHNSHEPPIGRALWVKIGRGKITAKVEFAPTEMGEEVWTLFKGGFISAFSVGFMPKEGHSPTPDDIKKNPDLAEARFIFTKWELLEFSAVPVPANPEALATAIKTKDITLGGELIKQFDIQNDIEVEEDVEIEKELVRIERADVVIVPDVDITAETKKAMHEAIEKHKGVVYAE